MNATAEAQDLFQQSILAFQRVMQKGAEVQEQSAQCFTDMLHGFGSTNYWQRQGAAALEQFAETNKRNLDESIRLMNENARTSMELLERALHTRR